MLKHKRALVTGGARGLGRGIADAFCENGASVVVLDLLEPPEHSCDRLYRQVDLSDRGQLAQEFDAAVQKLGGIDILVNAAGVNHKCPSAQFPISAWDMVLQVNLTAPFLLSQLAGKHMLAQKKGEIINIASMNSFLGGEATVAYAVSKGGISQLTKALCNEWANQNIQVNAIAPGFMMTDMNRHISAENDPERYEKIRVRIPFGRWGYPDDLKALAVFLAQDGNEYINGAIIPCDGGYLAY